MGRGSKHSKNAGVMGSESMSYYEKRAMGFGTLNERLGKNPVCDARGNVYSKEAILEYILHQKKEKKKQLELWQAEQARLQREASEKALVKQQAELLVFDRQNHMAASAKTTSAMKRAIDEAADKMHETNKGAKNIINIHEYQDRSKEVKSFWLPSKTPEAAELVEKPSADVASPADGRKLRLKDLVDLEFTRVPEGEPGRYMDPITRETLTNSSRLVVLKESGQVLLRETYEKCIKPEGTYNGKRVNEKDVISLKSGSTGFSRHDGEKVRSQKHFHLGPGNGLADRRGQAANGASKTGLKFWN